MQEYYYPIYVVEKTSTESEAHLALPNFTCSVKTETPFSAVVLLSNILVSEFNQRLSKGEKLPVGMDKPSYLQPPSNRNDVTLFWIPFSIDNLYLPVKVPGSYHYKGGNTHFWVLPLENIWTEGGINDLANRAQRNGKTLDVHGKYPFLHPGRNGFNLPVLHPINFDLLLQEMTTFCQAYNSDYNIGTVLEDADKINQFIEFMCSKTLEGLKENLHKYSILAILKFVLRQHELITYLIYHQREDLAMSRYSGLRSADIHAMYHTESDRTRAQISLALCQLLEMSVAENPQGKERLTESGVDTLLVLSSLTRGMWALKSRMRLLRPLPSLVICPSGLADSGLRGDPCTFENKIWHEYMLERLEDARERETGGYLKYTVPATTRYENLCGDKREQAYLDEFNLTYTQLREFRDTLLKLCFKTSKAYHIIPESKICKELTRECGWTEAMGKIALNLFCLEPRGPWEQVPDGYEWIDIDPDNQYGRLSALRRPLIRLLNQNGELIIFIGERWWVNAFDYFESRIRDDKYPTKENSELDKWIKRCRGEEAKAFVKTVQNWFKMETKMSTHLSVKLHGILNLPKDIGDIDIAAVDFDNSILYSIECKNITHSRTANDMTNEFNKFGILPKNNDFMNKHLKRDEYLRTHIGKIQTHFRFATSPMIVSLIITSDTILAPFITKNLPLPVISFHRLMKDGEGALEKCRLHSINVDDL